MRGEGYEEVRGGVRKHLKSRNSNSLNSPPNPSTLIPSSDETPPLISTLRFYSYSSPPPVHPADSGAVAPCKGGAPPGGRLPARPNTVQVRRPQWTRLLSDRTAPTSLPRAVPRGLSTPGRPYHVRGPQDDRPGADMATAAAPSAVEPIAAAPLESHGHHWE